jgi:DNA-nicking Smr family endonuclease
MKKREPSKQTQAEFKNKPFKSLKGFAPAPPAKKIATSSIQRTIKGSDDDEASLFLRAAEGVKRLDSDADAPVVPAAAPVPEKKESMAPEDEQLFLSSMRKIGTIFRDASAEREFEEQAPRSASSRMRQLKRGTVRISQELDLHGFMKDEALARLEQFITAAGGSGQRAVLVITGKGINSPEGPVLPGAVAGWLRGKGKGHVAEFFPAPRDLGGSGAYVVFLKMK